MTAASAEIDAYIARAAPAAQPVLTRIREIVRQAAPEASEVMSYGMPTFRLKRIIVHMGAFKSHIGLFPPVKGDDALIQALAAWRGPKGNLSFPLDQQTPYDLIERVVRRQVMLDQAKAPVRKRAKPA